MCICERERQRDREAIIEKIEKVFHYLRLHFHSGFSYCANGKTSAMTSHIHTLKMLFYRHFVLPNFPSHQFPAFLLRALHFCNLELNLRIIFKLYVHSPPSQEGKHTSTAVYLRIDHFEKILHKYSFIYIFISSWSFFFFSSSTFNYRFSRVMILLRTMSSGQKKS